MHQTKDHIKSKLRSLAINVRSLGEDAKAVVGKDGIQLLKREHAKLATPDREVLELIEQEPAFLEVVRLLEQAATKLRPYQPADPHNL